MPKWGAWHRRDLQYVRSQGIALIRQLPVHARETIRYYETAAVLLPFCPKPPLDSKAPSLPKNSFFCFVISDWTLHVCALTTAGKMIKLELPWLAIQKVDRASSMEAFLDENVNEYSEGIRIEQMLIDDPDNQQNMHDAGTFQQEAQVRKRRTRLFMSSRRFDTGNTRKQHSRRGGKGDLFPNALVVATLEKKSCLFFHIWRAWIGAHMRVALYQSRVPETPYWFMPPLVTIKSMDAAVLGLDPHWRIDASNDFQWHYTMTMRPASDFLEGDAENEPETPKSQIVGSNIADAMTASYSGRDLDARSPGMMDFEDYSTTILRWSPAHSNHDSMKGYYGPQSAIKAFVQSGALHSPVPPASSPFTMSAIQTLSPSMTKLRGGGIESYGRKVSACKEQLFPRKGNYLMTPNRDDLIETNMAIRDLEAELKEALSCMIFDMRDVTWLRELAQEASFCSSSLSRELQAALFKSEPYMVCLVKKLSFWVEVCTMYGDGGGGGPLSRQERLEYQSPEALKENSMRVSRLLREQRMQARETQEQQGDLEQLNRSAAEIAKEGTRGLSFASRVGQGRPGLSHIIRQMRYHNLLIDEDKINDDFNDEELSAGGRTQELVAGLKSERSRRSLGMLSVKSQRDSWRSWSEPGTPALRTPVGTQRHRSGPSAVAIGRRWEALVGRMMAVTAWQKSRVMLLAVHKTLQFSEGCPARLQWMSEDDPLHLDGDDQAPVTWRNATKSLIHLLFKIHTPLHVDSPIMHKELNSIADKERMNGPFAGLWWSTSDTDPVTLDLIVSCLFDLLGLSNQAQATEKDTQNCLQQEIASLSYDGEVHPKLCSFFMRLTSLMLDPNPPALGFEDCPTPQELLSVLAFRYANVLLLLLRTIPESSTRLYDEYEEEIKYILWDETLPQPPVFGLGSGQFLCYVNDMLYREVIHSLLPEVKTV